MQISFNADSLESSLRLAQELGALLENGDVVLLYGDMGAGKTAFTKGIAEGMGIQDDIQSPTFNIVIQHYGDPDLYHFDLYRLDDVTQLEDIDFYELVDYSTEGASVIEWPERFNDEMPEDAVSVRISVTDEFGRAYVVSSSGTRSETIVISWADAWRQ